MEITVIRILVVLIACIVIYMWINYYRHEKLLNDYKKNHNQVKFYVARDEDDGLFLYMGKPFRGIKEFHPYQNGCIITSDDLSNFGLNKDDYSNLKWEDEPVEVFINLEE